MGKTLIYLLLIYQKTKKIISPMSTCRFYPTCSEYAIQAIRKYGAANGIYLALKRLIRCNQWFPGGIDLVP